MKDEKEEIKPAPLGEEFASMAEKRRKEHYKSESLGESSEEQKTSADWYLQYPEPVLMDPDGWNRKDWKFSWYEEKITLREFEKRRLMSTVRLNIVRPPSPTSEAPEEQEELWKFIKRHSNGHTEFRVVVMNDRKAYAHVLGRLRNI